MSKNPAAMIKKALMDQLDVSDGLLDVAKEMAEIAENHQNMKPEEIERKAEAIYEHAIALSRLVGDAGKALAEAAR